jgi:Zn-dependent protease
VNQNIPLGRILGIKVGMSWTVLLIAGFYVYVLATQQFPNEAWGMSTMAYWTAGILGALAFFGSLLVHEMSHALLARRAGIEVRGITLWLLGGFAELGSEPTTPGHQFTIAAGGPVSNLALGGIFWVVHILITGSADPFVAGYGTSGLVGVVFGWLAFVNFLLGAFNLLPAAPLDGGQLFSAGIWAATGNRSVARRWAAYLGNGLGGLGVDYGNSTINDTGPISGIWIILIGWWIISAAQGDLRRVGVEQTLGQTTVGQLMRPEPPIYPASITIDQLLSSLYGAHIPQALCAQEPDGRIVGLLTESQITHADPATRASVPIGHLAFPIDRVVCALTNDGALDVARKMSVAPVQQALVLQSNGRVAGIVGAAEINQAIRRTPKALARR